jgi:hypothetical protein
MTRACFGVKQELPMEIPAKGSAVVTFHLDIHEPGPFDYEVPLYLDDAGFREVMVKVRGEAAAAK